MNIYPIDINFISNQYQRAFRLADAVKKADGSSRGPRAGDGKIDDDDEVIAAAKEVSEVATAKYTGTSVTDAEAYLRKMKLIIEPLVFTSVPTQYQAEDDVSLITVQSNSIKIIADGYFLNQVNFGPINSKGHNTLIVQLKSIKNPDAFGWKAMFGLSIDEITNKADVTNTDTAMFRYRDPVNFPKPKGMTIMDNFIPGVYPAGQVFEYDITGITDFYLGGKMVISPYELEFFLKD